MCHTAVARLFCWGCKMEDTQSAHSLCKVSHTIDRWWNHWLDSKGKDQETCTTEDDWLLSSPRRFLPTLIMLTIWSAIWTSVPCSSSVTVFCIHVLFLQLEADRFTFCTYSPTMEGTSANSLDLLQAYTKSWPSTPSLLFSFIKWFARWMPVILYNSQCLVSSATRALSTMPCIAVVKGEELLKRDSWQYHPNNKSTTPHKCLYCTATCLLYPESWPAVVKSFSESMAFVYEVSAVTYSTPIKVSTMIISCLSNCWYIFMSRHKLATLLIPLSKRQQWHKPTRNAIMITTHLSRLMLPVKNMHRSCCCNSALINHRAPQWKVSGVYCIQWSNGWDDKTDSWRWILFQW